MSTRRGLICLGLVAYLFFLLWQLPAALAFALLQGRMASTLAPLHFRELQGTWRQGVALDGHWRSLELPELRWQLKPWSLLSGQLSAQVGGRTGSGTLAATVSQGFTGFLLRDLEGEMGLAELAPFLSLPHLQLAGTLVSQGQLAIHHGRIVAAAGKLLWRQAAVTVLQPVALGDLEALLTTTSEGVQVALSDKGGPVQVEGTIIVQNDGHYSLTATVAARQAELQKQLDSIAAFGEKQKDGRVKFIWGGVMPLLTI